jgi:hypothetical protein
MPDTKVTTDHEEIRRWAEERGGKPAAVVGPQEEIAAGGLRIDFPDYDSGEQLEQISWTEFFEKFDEQNLSFFYQEEMVC